MNQDDNTKNNKRGIDLELDNLELKITELKNLYEQFFTGTQPQPPDDLNKQIKLQIRNILNAPFKTTGAKFRLQTLTQRYNTFSMYFERTNNKRNTGTYSRDVFKTKLKEEGQKATLSGKLKPKSASEDNFKELYQSYVNAHQNSNSEAQDYESFRNNLKQQAQQLKKERGLSKISFKVVLKGNKVVIKASGS